VPSEVREVATMLKRSNRSVLKRSNKGKGKGKSESAKKPTFSPYWTDLIGKISESGEVRMPAVGVAQMQLSVEEFTAWYLPKLAEAIKIPLVEGLSAKWLHQDRQTQSSAVTDLDEEVKVQAQWIFSREQVSDDEWMPTSVKGTVMEGVWKCGKAKYNNWEIIETMQKQKLKVVNDLVAGLLRKGVQVPHVTMNKVRSQEALQEKAPAKKKRKKKSCEDEVLTANDESRAIEIEGQIQAGIALERKLEKLKKENEELIKSTSSLRDKEADLNASESAKVEALQESFKKSADLNEKCHDLTNKNDELRKSNSKMALDFSKSAEELHQVTCQKIETKRQLENEGEKLRNAKSETKEVAEKLEHDKKVIRNLHSAMESAEVKEYKLYRLLLMGTKEAWKCSIKENSCTLSCRKYHPEFEVTKSTFVNQETGRAWCCEAPMCGAILEVKSKEHGWLDIEEAQNTGIMRSAHAEVFKNEIRMSQAKQLVMPSIPEETKFSEELPLKATTTQVITQEDFDEVAGPVGLLNSEL